MIKDNKILYQIISWVVVTFSTLLIIIIVETVKQMSLSPNKIMYNPELIFAFIGSLVSLMLWHLNDGFKAPITLIFTVAICIIEAILYAVLVGKALTFVVKFWIIISTLLFIIAVFTELFTLYRYYKRNKQIEFLYKGQHDGHTIDYIGYSKIGD